MKVEPGQERAQRLHERLIEGGRTICRSEALLGHCAAAAPELVSTIDQTVALREAVDWLAGTGALTVPRGRHSWDESFKPALPLFVIVFGVRPARRDQAWQNHAWRPELGWAASLPTINDLHLSHLVAINDWLAATKGGRVPVVPVRVRSAEVLGDEKALDGLAKTKMFGNGRVTWEMLAAVRIEPPLALRRVGPGGAVLVVENADPYWLAIEALTGHAGPVGLVAWGAGRGGGRSLPTLALEPGVTGPVWYWGDFDPTGLDIPTDASPAVAAAGLGPLMPAEPLYEAMADHADRVGPTAGREVWGARNRSAWLGPRLWARFSHVVDRDGRVAQEVLDPEQVTAAAQQLASDL